MPNTISAEMAALLNLRLGSLVHSEEDCRSIYERRKSSFQSMCVGEGDITTAATQAIQATDRSYAIWNHLRDQMHTLIEKVAPQTDIRFSIAAYEQLAAALPTNSDELAALRKKAYSFAIASSEGQAGAADSTLGEALRNFFPNENETTIGSIALILDTVSTAYKSRLATVRMDSLFMQLVQLYRALLCGGIWHITGSSLQRKERAKKLRDLALAGAGEGIPGLGLLIEIAKLILEWDPNSPPDIVKQAKKVEEYLQLYKKVINEWIESAESLGSVLTQNIQRYE